MSEPTFVGTLKLIQLKLFLELSNLILGYLDLSLGILVQLLDLLGCDLRKFGFKLISLHLVN